MLTKLGHLFLLAGFPLLAQLTIQPAQLTIETPGQTVRYSWNQQLGTPSWSVTPALGTINGGVYTAPLAFPAVATVVTVKVVDFGTFQNFRFPTATATLIIPAAVALPGCTTCPAGKDGAPGKDGLPGRDGLPGPPGIGGGGPGTVPPNLITTDLNTFCSSVPTTIPCFPDGAVIGFQGFSWRPRFDLTKGKFVPVIGIDEFDRPIRTWPPPKSSAEECVAGRWSSDADRFYVCVPVGTGPATIWKFVSLSTLP